jgi:hypothetical protein
LNIKRITPQIVFCGATFFNMYNDSGLSHQSYHTERNQINRHNVIEHSGHQKNQNAGDQCKYRLESKMYHHKSTFLLLADVARDSLNSLEAGFEIILNSFNH